MWRSYSTRRNYTFYLNKWIIPRWKDYELADVRTVEVEAWLRSLPLARSTCAKIRNLMSVLFKHAWRHEFLDRNPICLVRQSAKRQKAPNVLTPAEVKSLLDSLALRERTLVLLAASTGLRQSELFALKWDDIDFAHGTMNVTRAIVYGVVGKCKTEASQKPVFIRSSLRCSISGDKPAPTTSPRIGFSPPANIAVESHFGTKQFWQFCASTCDQPQKGSAFINGLVGTRSATHTPLFYEVSVLNSKSCRN